MPAPRRHFTHPEPVVLEDGGELLVELDQEQDSMHEAAFEDDESGERTAEEVEVESDGGPGEALEVDPV